MKKSYKKTLLSCALGTVFLLNPIDARAITFTEALQLAIDTNPKIQALKKDISATHIGEDIAASGYRPDISLNGNAGLSYSNTDISSSDTLNPWGVTGTVTQPIYTGGSTMANVKAAKLATQSKIAFSDSAEQDIILDTAKAYLNVLRRKSVIELNKNNENVLSQQLIAEQQKFEFGDSTRTDVAQAESRLSATKANVQNAIAQYDREKAIFVSLVGRDPVDLNNPNIPINIPASRDEALDISYNNNTLRQVYILDYEGSLETVKSISGELLPRLDLVGSAGYNEEVSSAINDSTDASVKLNLKVPLYQSGSVRARKRQALETAEKKRHDIEQIERQITQNVDTAWAEYKAIGSYVQARKDQVKASEIALEGVREEEKIGSRTTLDVLDAEQEHLDAQVALVEAEFDYKIVVLSLVRAMGILKNELLGL